MNFSITKIRRTAWPVRFLQIAIVTTVIAVVSGPAVWASLCPFCNSIRPTLSQQLEANDVAVVAKLLHVPPPVDDLDLEFPKAEFEIVNVLKGDDLVATEMTFNAQLVGNYPKGEKFFLMGVNPPKLVWSTPMKTTEQVFQYIADIQKLPESGSERLDFFQDYFEHEQSILAFDAYDEFALAPYEDLIALKDDMHHDKLVQWVKDPEISVINRRLYVVMLGVCGNDADIKLFEDMLVNGDRKRDAGVIEPLVASYLTLKGESGMDLIEETFLADDDVDYTVASRVVSALRFHGTELSVISKDRIVAAVRRLLDRPEMADMIIPDLARWEDWTVVDKVAQLFRDADEDSNWVRVPAVTYLRACPLPAAKKHLEELEKIDPDSVKRADFLSGFLDDDEAEDDEESDEAVEEAADEEAVDEATEGADRATEETQLNTGAAVSFDDQTSSGTYQVLKVPVDIANPVQNKVASPDVVQNEVVTASFEENRSQPKNQPKNQSKILQPNLISSTFVSNSNTDRFPPPALETAPTIITETAPIAATIVPSMTWSIIFVPMGVSLVLFLVLWSVVNGWFERLIF